MGDENVAIVLDNGSGMFKAGFSGEDIPRVIFPTVTGYSYNDYVTQSKDIYFGYEALGKDNVSLHHPIQLGIITDWEHMESIWQHTFHNELNVATEDRPILLTESPLNPRTNRDKIMEIMFETFNIPSLYIAKQPVLSLYASGRTTGIVYDSGYNASHTVPIFEGNTLTHAINTADISGRDVTEHLIQLLTKRGILLGGHNTCDIKEKACYVALDYKLELKGVTNTNYELPDGEIVTLGNEIFTSPEILFNPSLHDCVTLGAHELINNSIQQCEKGIQKCMYSNIILSSGNTLFPGMAKRMLKELNGISPPRVRVKLIAPPERKYSVWIGGSILASMSSFQQMWLSNEEYHEGEYRKRRYF
ncbi:actin [Oopsacas minuta]|uniref:Actin n=1 Tax=Oopsacas minuta TaxID=111878 RepID=A0AAV7JLB1_9METZ|nr:actin [Oopsacas minuta]